MGLPEAHNCSLGELEVEGQGPGPGNLGNPEGHFIYLFICLLGAQRERKTGNELDQFTLLNADDKNDKLLAAFSQMFANQIVLKQPKSKGPNSEKYFT